jgi:uncharacterized protein YjbJ (UPF0337 family)
VILSRTIRTYWTCAPGNVRARARSAIDEFTCERGILVRLDARIVEMRSSTKDRVKGRVQEAKGAIKEKAGDATRDPNLQDRGTAEKVGGKVQRKVGEVKKVFGA